MTRQRYSYAADNPINGTDATGSDPLIAGGCAVGEAVDPLGGCVPGALAGAVGTGVAAGVGALVSLFSDNSGGDNTGEQASSQAQDQSQAPDCNPSEGALEDPFAPIGRNPAQDKLLTGSDVQRLKDAGLDPHDVKIGGSGSDLYKDPAGNVYEKPKGGAGPGEPLGINLNNLP